MFVNRYFVLVPSPMFGEETPPATPPATPPGDAGKPGEVQFTKEQQEKLNQLLASERKKAAEGLEQIRQAATTSAKQKAELETQIENLKKQYMTKEQLEAEKYERTMNEFKSNLETASKERDTWQSRFSETVVERDILAAAGPDAFNPELIVNILKPQTKLVEVTDDEGKPTGKFEPRVKMTKVKDGKPLVVEVVPSEAVKLMKEMPEKFGSLFKSTQAGGIGGGNRSGNKDVDMAELAKSNPEEYRRRYQEKNFPKKGK